MTFEELRKANIEICETAFNMPLQGVGSWTPNDWGVAIGGETGELLNELKKWKRGDYKNISLYEIEKKIAHEMADIVIYIDLLASSLGIDLEESIIEKFNIVSERKKSNIKLKYEDI